ncbi:hypothetical protein [Alishewanella longhuensis]
MQQALVLLLSQQHLQLSLLLPPAAANWRARLYQLQAVQQEEFLEDGSCRLLIQLSAAQWARLQKQSEQQLENYIVSQTVF